MQNNLSTPILFLIFNRPEETRKVFNEIRRARPAQLFIAADGPRPGKSDDIKKCNEVRQIIDKIDWRCNIRTLFRNENLGCKRAVSAAITWFFQNVEKGIILEDDCLPNPSFFFYCEEMLEKYKDDSRVCHINGNNFNAAEFMPTGFSYHFTYIPQVWGWATWRRAWNRYDVKMSKWREYDHHLYYKHCGLSKRDYKSLREKWKTVVGEKLDTWDYQWHFINMLEGSMAVTPVKNLVSNIGFNGEATHSPRFNPLKQNLPTSELQFPLTHPENLFIDENLNRHFKHLMIRESLEVKIKRKLLKNGIRIFS